MPPEVPAEPRAQEPDAVEPHAPSRRSPPRTIWEVLAENVLRDEPPDDPFAVAGRAAPRRSPGGYFSG
jgi:hypothetical protein